MDGLIVEGRFLLMELELIEPFLFLADEPRAAERFARRLAARLAERRASGSAASRAPAMALKPADTGIIDRSTSA